MESDLARHIITLADMFHGVSLEKCKELGYEFGLRNKLKLPSSWVENKKAGKSWWLGFKARHNLSIRLPEPTSVGRASAFNKHTVNEYFDNLAKVKDDNKFTAEQIFNVDETGVTTVQNPNMLLRQKEHETLAQLHQVKGVSKLQLYTQLVLLALFYHLC